jgi:hypothetical protein
LQPKKSKFLKILVKIWGVGLRNFPKSEKNFYAQNIIEWAENDLQPKKSKILKILVKIWGVGLRNFPKSEKNFYAQNILK